jgi:hypothetical protein
VSISALATANDRFWNIRTSTIGVSWFHSHATNEVSVTAATSVKPVMYDE